MDSNEENIPTNSEDLLFFDIDIMKWKQQSIPNLQI